MLLFLLFHSRSYSFLLFFFNDTPTTEIYTLSLHDALPISEARAGVFSQSRKPAFRKRHSLPIRRPGSSCKVAKRRRSEEHTSELQSRQYLVCRLLLEKKKKKNKTSQKGNTCDTP